MTSFLPAAQWLIIQLTKNKIPFKLINLGAGVKRITTETDTCPVAEKYTIKKLNKKEIIMKKISLLLLVVLFVGGFFVNVCFSEEIVTIIDETMLDCSVDVRQLLKEKNEQGDKFQNLNNIMKRTMNMNMKKSVDDEYLIFLKKYYRLYHCHTEEMKQQLSKDERLRAQVEPKIDHNNKKKTEIIKEIKQFLPQSNFANSPEEFEAMLEKIKRK